uniref:Troponin C-like isoform X2 n=1 Tax=Diabrotica virgifera virgifera TaxID=50390 RepID=A0A6P7H200_DIAVI
MDELPPEQIAVLRKAFEAFDSQKSGSIPCDMVADILRLMGQPFDKKILEELIEEVDADKSGRLEFEEFVTLAAKFIVEEDDEAMQKELKEAFRLYDKDGKYFFIIFRICNTSFSSNKLFDKSSRKFENKNLFYGCKYNLLLYITLTLILVIYEFHL